MFPYFTECVFDSCVSYSESSYDHFFPPVPALYFTIFDLWPYNVKMSSCAHTIPTFQSDFVHVLRPQTEHNQRLEQKEASNI